MLRSMTRAAVAGFMALAALSAVAVRDVSSAMAVVAPSVSPFAGTYSFPGGLTISDRGRITASYDDPNGFWRLSIRGRVSDDGRYSYTQTLTTFDFFHHRLSQFSVKHAGTMELDDVGNIVGTENTGGSFTWVRE